MLEMITEKPLGEETEFLKEEAADRTEPAGHKILVVDDEPPLLRLLAFLLTRQGYIVLTATNGEEALAILRRERPDLLVLDVMMPRLDGYAVATMVRTEPGFATVPIIMLTARAQQEDEERGLAVGVNAYMTKPFEPERLSEMIAGYLGAIASKSSG
jgi:CheY-like chemotaxis protein